MKYTAEEVRAIAKRLHDDITVADGDALMASDMLTDYAGRIKADEGANDRIDFKGMWNAMSDRAYAHPPAQAAQVDDSAVASFVERAASVICGKSFPIGSALAKAREISDLALSMLTTPEPVEQGEAIHGRCKTCGRATRAVCDGLDGNGLGCTNAPSVDLAAVREVIVWLRSGSMAITANAGIAADKLEAALQEGEE